MSAQCLQPGQSCWRCEPRYQDGSLGVSTVAVLTCLGHQQSRHFPTHEEAAQNLRLALVLHPLSATAVADISNHHAGGPLCDQMLPDVQAPALGQGPLSAHASHRGPSARTLVAAAELPPSRTVGAAAPPATLSLPSGCTPCTPTGTLPGFVFVGLQSLTATGISHIKTTTQTWRMPLFCRHLWLQAHAALLQLHQHAGASDLHSRHCW